jgi:hypothetical protein
MTNEIHLLRGVIEEFWLLISIYNTVENIVNELKRKYTGEHKYITAKVQYSVNTLVKRNLIVEEAFCETETAL